MQNPRSYLDDVKNKNLQQIINIIHKDAPISRAQVAAKLNLSRSTVSSLVDELIKIGLISEIGLNGSTSQGGRRSIQLGFNSKSRYCVGVDISQTYISLMITDLDGNIEFRAKWAPSNDLDEIISRIKKEVEGNNIPKSSIVCMGISVPGVTDAEKGVVIESSTLGWMDIPAADIISQHFPFPVFILNDINCLALGEYWVGAAKDSTSIYLIGINNGLGSSLVIDGELYLGHSFQAGEIGYCILGDCTLDDGTNTFGGYGSLEHIVSGWALSKHGYSYSQIFAEYALGNKEIIPIVDKFLNNLSIAIANSIVLLNPECVIIGGEVAENMQLVIEIIQETVDRIIPVKSEIRLAQLGSQTYNLGAIAYSLTRINLADS